jgi:hypothetical protein
MANYAFVENDEVVNVYDTLPTNWKNISNLNILEDENLKDLGWYKIIKDESFDPNLKVSVNSSYSFKEGNVYEECEVYDIPQNTTSNSQSSSNEDTKSFDEKLQDVRMVRDQLMNEFQWRYFRYERETRLGLEPKDVLSDLDEYMNSLSNITEGVSYSNIDNIVWPKYEKDN